jgi:hypothetical protein
LFYQEMSQSSEPRQIKEQDERESSSASFDMKEQALRVLLVALAFATRTRYLDVPKYVV